MRRRFLFSLLLLLSFRAITFAADLPQKPNILLIYLDDFGWRDTGYMGSDFYETPHIDRLARGGMIFTDAYSAAANCAPARACLMSGQYTPRHEVYNVGTRPRGDARHRRLKHIPGTTTLRTDVRTWAHRLQDAGYRTGSFGKWHLSGDPRPYGFDVNVGGTHSGSPPNGYFPPHGNAPGLRDVPPGEYLTDTINDAAIEFIERNAEKPWCVYLTHFAVHTPLEAKPDLVQQYQAKARGELHDNATMAAMIQSVDDGVGRLIASLDETGQRDHTVILFFSDNGGYGPATDMDPLRGYKGTYYEGGIRVPFFVNWPGVVEAGSSCNEPIIGVDLYPTLCAIAGVRPPEGQPLDGIDLVPLFKGDGVAGLSRPLFWHFPAYLQSYPSVADEQRDPLFRSRPVTVVRKGPWKLHLYYEDEGVELYNLAEDIGERKNLAAVQPERREELLAEIRQWRERIDAPVPHEPNPAFDAKAEAEAIRRARGRSRGAGFD